MREDPRRRARRGRRTTLAVVSALAVALAGTGAAYLALRTEGSPRQSAAAYLRAWQRGDYAAMTGASVGTPAGGLRVPLTQAASDLGLRGIRLTLGPVTANGDTARASFRAAASLASGHVWSYRGQLSLLVRDHRWWVDWSPSAIYPSLRAGQRFSLHAAWPARAPILAADGTALDSPAVLARSGSIAMLTGGVSAATAAQAKALGAPYQAGDLIGQGGIEQAYQRRLAGEPAMTIAIAGPGTTAVRTVATLGGAPGRPVRTSIDLRVQYAASQAVRSASTSRPIDLVAVQPSTGKVLAVVQRPGGFDRALSGIFPPGSTFKIVTASALAERGFTPSTPVQCPATVSIGGASFHNYDFEKLGATTLQTAFAVSCNTTFAMLAAGHLDGASLAATAAQFGFNATPALGVPATLGHFTVPSQSVDLAADAFGQGTDLVNPLAEASTAAAIADGAWRPPVLVTSPAPAQSTGPHRLSAAVLAALRPMMAAVVASGTAAGVGFPPGVHGKTGTAEYGSGPNPPSHAWFVGYRGDLAFAVLVEGGGVGADQAGPVANDFVRHA